jgi:hypothetical protein
VLPGEPVDAVGSDRMLGVGDRIPDGQVFVAPRESAELADLVAERPALFIFFLFAWSST